MCEDTVDRLINKIIQQARDIEKLTERNVELRVELNKADYKYAELLRKVQSEPAGEQPDLSETIEKLRQYSVKKATDMVQGVRENEGVQSRKEIR